jgi:uncharacterized protein involved in type VI secretion and phage assembly
VPSSACHRPGSPSARDVAAPGAGGLLPAVEGLHIGVVKKLDGDPEGENSAFRWRCPYLQAETPKACGRGSLQVPWLSNGFGAFFLPEVGDEVVLGYFNNDPSHPVILGSLYSSKHTPPYALAAENNTKAIVTRCKSTASSSTRRQEGDHHHHAGQQQDRARATRTKSILLQDQNSNKHRSSPRRHHARQPQGHQAHGQGGITLDAVNAISSLTSKADVQARAPVSTSAAKRRWPSPAKGNATAELVGFRPDRGQGRDGDDQLTQMVPSSFTGAS